MTHEDNLDKEIYPVSDIKTNDYLFRAKCFDNVSKETFMVKLMIKLTELDGKIYFAELLQWAINKGYYDEYFKNYKIIRDIISQENERRLTRYVPTENIYVPDDDEIPF